MNVYDVFQGLRKTRYQVIVKHDPWVNTLYTEGGSVDGRKFAKRLLKDFDLQICRNGIFNQSYYHRCVIFNKK